MSLGCSYRHLAFKVSEEELPQFEKIMNAFSKTALCANRKYLPPLVAQAVALANDLGFIHCCIPEQGALLRVLARGRAGGIIGETGTERGAGLALITSAVGPETRLGHSPLEFWPEEPDHGVDP